MDRVRFLNNLAATNVSYNLGAGVPPLELYDSFDPVTCFNHFTNHYPGLPILNYHQTEGLLRNQAVQTLIVNEGIQIDEDNIVVTNGVQESLAIIALLFREKTIACFDPYYPGIVDAVKMSGGNIKFLSAKNWREDVSALESGSILYISADFANPTGAVWSTSDREELVKISDNKGFYIFDDATYRAFYLNEKKPSLISYQSDCVIHALSFSKILSPGLRTAFIYLPKNLVSSFVKVKANMSLNNSGITQAILGGWLLQHNHNIEGHLHRAKKRLSDNGRVLEKFGCAYEGGFFATLPMSEKNITLEWSFRLMQEKGIAVIPMSLFSESENAKHQLRLALAKIEAEKLDEAINEIVQFN